MGNNKIKLKNLITGIYEEVEVNNHEIITIFMDNTLQESSHYITEIGHSVQNKINIVSLQIRDIASTYFNTYLFDFIYDNNTFINCVNKLFKQLDNGKYNIIRKNECVHFILK